MTHKLNWRITCILVLIAGMTACASTDETDYSAVGSLPPLEVPPDLTSVPTDRSFDLPASQSQAGKDKRSPIVGETNSVIPAFDKARIVRAGTQRWAVIRSKPEPLWVAMRSFLVKLGWAINKENPKTGIMETDWKETRPLVEEGGLMSFFGSKLGSTSLKDRFRFRLERGSDEGTTELFVTHRMMEELVVAGGGTEVVETYWQPRASDPEREAEMLNLFLRYLESGKINKKKPDAKVDSVPLTTTVGKDKDGYPAIQVSDPINVTWRRLGIALDRAGFLVQDRDVDKNIYYVYRTVTVKKESGFLGGLFGGGEESKVQKFFQVRAVASGETTFITLLDSDGNKLESDNATELLEQLDKKLQY